LVEYYPQNIFLHSLAKTIFLTLKMSDDKDQEKGKRQRRTSKIVYHRCSVCGGRKKEEYMAANKQHCMECVEKNSTNPSSFWNSKQCRKQGSKQAFHKK